MNVDQLDELIRKYLSTGVAMVLVLVGPAAAPSGTTTRPPTTATSAHSTGAASTNGHAPSRPGDRADPTARSDDPPPGGNTYRTAKPTPEPSADPAEHSGSSRSPSRSTDTTADATAEPTTDSAKPTAKPTNDAQPTNDAADVVDPTKAADATAEPTGPTAPYDPADNGRSRRDTRPAADGPTAAAANGWGTPDREDDFTDDLSGWGLYDGPGHANKGIRSPGAAEVADGVLTLHGDADGTTAGMAWNHGKGQKYGRWEGRVRAPASDPTYNALLLLWPDAEDFPRGGEIDFMEMTDHTRQATNVFLHHGADNAQEHGSVEVDATQWHNWAVEWTPKGVTTFVDGKQWWHTDNTAALPPGPMHLCIQLDWFPQKGKGVVTPSQMQVDWVRQYPLDAPSSDTSVMHDLITRTFGW